MSDKTAKNDITGDFIHSKPNSDMFEQGWDRIFGKKKALEESIKENEELLYELDDGQLTDEQYAKIKELSRMDIISQNGNDGLHYEYELDKSTGEVIRKETNG
jgi:hypothetical protein